MILEEFRHILEFMQVARSGLTRRQGLSGCWLVAMVRAVANACDWKMHRTVAVNNRHRIY